MCFRNKIVICIFLMFALSTQGQTYAKYTTSKAKAAAPAQKEKTVDAKVQDKHIVKAERQPEEKVPEVAAGFNDLYSKGLHLYKDNKFEEAAKAYTEALQVCPTEWKYLVLQARSQSYLGMEEYNKAIADCTTAIEKTTVHNNKAMGSLYYVRSQAYKSRRQAGDTALACADYKKALETGYRSGTDDVGYDCDKE